MKSTKASKILTQVSILILLIAQISCANLKALRDFTDESVKAGAKFKELAADPYRSCAAQIYYGQVKSDGFKKILTFDTPDGYLKSVDPETTKPCKSIKADWVNFMAANKVLMTYLYVMGQLADEGITNADDEFSEIKAAIPSNPPPILGSALRLANTITNLLLDAKRRDAIKKAVITSNEDIGKLSDGLTNALSIYLELLQQEKKALREAYDFAQAGQQSRSAAQTNGSDDPLLTLASQETLEAAIQKMNAKIRAAEAYQKILSGIKKGHQELYEEAQKGFDRKNAVRIALKYAPSIQTNYNDLVRVFQ